MKNKTNMRRRLWLIPLVLLSCILLFTACDGNKGPAVSSIEIKSGDKPQTVFVKGQELDLSQGKLSVTLEDGTQQTIALNDPSITVTGYNKDSVGDQELTITYGDKTLRLSISVVNRMTFVGYETEYFIGDVFNTTKGSVTVVKNDGSKVNARLNDTDVISVVSFDSATAGSKQVTIRYSNGTEEYTDSLNVNVHGVGNIKFVKPSKTSYGSHETEISLLGGYFQVTADGNANLTKFVDLTTDMVTGFQPAAATRDNIDTPLKQAITVSYAGQTYQYEISITYSGVSLMQDAIRDLKGVNLEGENATVTEQQGKTALFALQSYMKMTPAERDKISQSDRNLVARVAAMYGNAYANILAQPFSEALFIVDGGISLNMTATRESISKVIELLSDPKNEFIQFSLFLAEFAAEFARVTLPDGTTVAESVKFAPEADINYAISVMEYMLKLHEDLADVPDDWTVETLKDYERGVEDAVRHIGNFENAGLIPHACAIVSKWRTNDDYLRIIYTYYYHYNQEKIVDRLWNKVPLIGDMQLLYNYISYAVVESSKMQNSGASALWYPTDMFFYYYGKCMETANAIKNSDDTLLKDLYAYIDFDALLETYLELAGVGHANLATSLYGDPQFAALMAKYMSLVELYMDPEKGVDMAENKAELQELFDMFIALSPAKQRSFMGTLLYLYDREEVRDALAMDFTDGVAGDLFVAFLAMYMETYLPEAAVPMFQEFMFAVEYYMNNSVYDDAMANFLAKMESVIVSYETLSAADKAVFDQYMGTAYQKYKKLYTINKNGSSANMSEFEALRDELLQALENYETLAENLSDPETGAINEGMVGALAAAFERVMTITDKMRNHEDDNIRAWVSTLKVAFDEESSLPIDYAALNLRWNFIVMLHRITYTATAEDGTETKRSAWKIYSAADNNELLSEAYYVIMQQYNGGTEFDAAKVLQAMKVYREHLTKNVGAVGLFYNFDADFYYYAGLRNFFGKVLTAGNAELGTKLLEVEELYAQYVRATDNAEAKTAFMNAMAEAIALYAAVTDSENFNTYLAEMYNFYLNMYNSMNTAA